LSREARHAGTKDAMTVTAASNTEIDIDRIEKPSPN